MSPLKQAARLLLDQVQLPATARVERRKDSAGLPSYDPGAEAVIEAGVSWLARAQDRSSSHDGGVARHFSLLDGWSTSYPETTGYIIPTLLAYGHANGKAEPVERALRMADWLVAIQFAEGGFQGGMIGQTPRVPVTFNTGQILIGLAAAAHADARFLEPMRRAADWLVQTQDADGCWRKHPTPFAAPGEKTYETHVALGLFEAAKLEPDRGYLEAGLRQVDWALANQQTNGWFAKCCLDFPERPLTHTLGYALRGIIAAHDASGQARYLSAARLAADGLLEAIDEQGRLPGRLDSSWRPAADFVCLTGSSQLAECWLLLFKVTKSVAYRMAAQQANGFVRKTIAIDGPGDVRGGVKGSFPVDGEYGRWQYLNWACKFMIDANQAEIDCT